MQRTFSCFGLVIHGFGPGEVFRTIEANGAEGRSTWIVTANPEILLAASKDPSYWETLRQADLRLVDGFGLQLVGKWRGASPRRLTGVELADKLVESAAARRWTVGLVGGFAGAAPRAAEVLQRRHPGLKLVTAEGGRVEPDGTGDATNLEDQERLLAASPEILFVAFGHPKQESWIARYKERFPSVRVFVGVGGTFDFWAGTASRAPRWLQVIGLEWLWRLVRQPSRMSRIVDAVVRFPIAVWKWRS